ncbi:BTAD domain-containing putative transcriptional regulator [Angustibacter sp. McL0619]|uniref:BTAD domain-containing putative transcriptional regulator n=1 Tax=Angustibacter sp. McL0619 TaxID=3415676 RepID=UPI003CF95601
MCAVLAMLALRAGSLVTTEQLIDGVWGEDAPLTARNALQVHISSLRKALAAAGLAPGAVVEGTSSGYVLRLAPERVDALVAERLLTNARSCLASGQVDAAQALAAQALALWSGPALTSVARAPFAVLEAGRLGQLRLDLTELTAVTLAAAGRHADVVRLAESVLTEQPFHEGWWCKLVTALHHSGRTADALAAYERAAHGLREELGLDPGSELSILQEQLLRGDVAPEPGQPGAAPAVRATSRLPEPPTPLIGREGELAELVALLRAPGVRLVTLTGPGGAGKTRLAVGLASESAAAYPDGAFLVTLAAVTEPGAMWTSIAESLDVPTSDRTVTGLLGHLASRSLLLVLDNLEQLADAHTVVSQLLRAAPDITVVATSRRPLHLAAEHEHAVPPLELPRQATLGEAEGSAAVSLFVHQARRVRSTFVLDNANVADVVHLCHRLDGLPLAIELAAARSKLLSPAAMVKRLDHVLGLHDVGVDRPRRQQTLRATIAWSYDLLSPVQQRVFRRLGVFVGGADLAAVEAVTEGCRGEAEAFDVVADLLDASLISVTEGSDGEPRITTLQTIGDFAREQLRSQGEAESVELLFAQHCAAVFHAASDLMAGSGDSVVAARRLFEVEHDNVRSVLESLLGSGSGPSPAPARVRAGQVLCADLWRMWTDGGALVEGRVWAQRAIDRSPDEDSVALLQCLCVYAELAILQRDFTMSRDTAARAVGMGRRLGDLAGLIGALIMLGRSEHIAGSPDVARAVFDEVITLASSEAEHQQRLAEALVGLAYMEMGEGRYERSLQLQDAALQISVAIGDERKTLYARHNFACTLRLMGHLAEARTRMREQFTPVIRLANPDLLIVLAEDYAALLAELGDHAGAVRLLGAADALRSRVQMPRLPQQEEEIRQPFAMARAALSGVDWDAAYAAGLRLGIETALGEAYHS